MSSRMWLILLFQRLYNIITYNYFYTLGSKDPEGYYYYIIILILQTESLISGIHIVNCPTLSSFK